MAWIREHCRAHRGPLASVGTLALGPTGLDFQPEGSLDKLVGLPSVELAMADIEDVRLEGLERMLHVQVGGEVWRFAGDGARRVGRVLALALSGKQPQPVLVSVEAYLAEQGRVDVFIKADRIALVDAGAPLDAPWERVPRTVPVRTRGLPARLVVGEGRQVWTLSGPGVHKLAAVLLLPGGVGYAPRFVEGAQQSGLLAHPGLIAISGGGLAFAPSGLLDQLIGQEPEAWPWKELRTMELRRGGVVFGMEDGPVVLSSHDAEAMWAGAVAAVEAWMEARASQGRAWTAAPERGAVDRPVDRAPGLITGDSEHQLLAVNLELYSHQLALWLPGSGRPRKVDREEVERSPRGTLRIDGQRLHVPLSVSNRWALGSLSSAGAETARFARLVDSAGRVLATADSVSTSELLGLRCVALPGRPPRELAPGLPVRLELSGGGSSTTHSGVTVALLAPEEDSPGWRMLLATGRGGAKAAAPRPLSPTLDATLARLGSTGGMLGSAMPGEVVSLARGGCELRVPKPIARGALLRVVLQLPSGAQRLSARVEAAARRMGRHHATLTFLELDENTLQAIDSVVVSADFEGIGRD